MASPPNNARMLLRTHQSDSPCTCYNAGCERRRNCFRNTSILRVRISSYILVPLILPPWRYPILNTRRKKKTLSRRIILSADVFQVPNFVVWYPMRAFHDCINAPDMNIFRSWWAKSFSLLQGTAKDDTWHYTLTLLLLRSKGWKKGELAWRGSRR